LENKKADQYQAIWGMDILLLRLIQKGELEQDPRREATLAERYQVFCEEKSNTHFSIENVVKNGWVRIVWNRWYLPQGLIHSRSVESTNELFLFLKKLSLVSYSDERKLMLRDVESELSLHRMRYPELPELDWFISECQYQN
jgi:hypothetical protein